MYAHRRGNGGSEHLYSFPGSNYIPDELGLVKQMDDDRYNLRFRRYLTNAIMFSRTSSPRSRSCVPPSFLRSIDLTAFRRLVIAFFRVISHFPRRKLTSHGESSSEKISIIADAACIITSGEIECLFWPSLETGRKDKMNSDMTY
jgi:hypothetical protein